MSQIEIPGNVSKTRTSQCRSTIRLSWRPPKPRFVKTNNETMIIAIFAMERTAAFCWICLFAESPTSRFICRATPNPTFRTSVSPRFRKGFFKERFWLEVASEQWETKVGVYCCSTNLCKINKYYTEVITSKYLRIWNAMKYWHSMNISMTLDSEALTQISPNLPPRNSLGLRSWTLQAPLQTIFVGPGAKIGRRGQI